MAPIVLVHGAWHGGWCWQRLAPLLRDRGHEVHRPTLTGLGDRAHLRPLLGDALGLDTHVDDVVGLLEHEDLHDVVLVGHSYGGMVITGVADRAADRLARLTYLDAFLPEPGRSMFDVLRPERRDLFQEQARRTGGLVPSPPPQAFGVSDPADAEWVAARLCPQPVRTFSQPLPLGPARALPRTYLHCTAGAVVATFAPFAERVREDPAWDYVELDAGHDVMLTAPDVLAAAVAVGR